MPIEYAAVRAIHKPWGVSDLKPWSDIDGARDAVGECGSSGPTITLPFLRCCSSYCSRAGPCPSRSIGRHLRPRDGVAERQERGMVHHLGETVRADRRWPEAPGDATGIAGGDRERLDRGAGSMASSCGRRCHLRPSPPPAHFQCQAIQSLPHPGKGSCDLSCRKITASPT